MPYKYAYQGDVKDTARAVARDVPISSKHAIMIANWIRGKPVTRVQRDLQQVMDKRTAVPFTRFTEGAGHKPGIGPGKYPVKAATEFLRIVNSVAANATDLGLGENLKVVAVTTHRAASAMRMGRKRGQQSKRSHIEIVVAPYEMEIKHVKKAKPAQTEKVEQAESKAKPEQKPAKKAPAAPAKKESAAEKKSEEKADAKKAPKQEAAPAEKSEEKPAEAKESKEDSN